MLIGLNCYGPWNGAAENIGEDVALTTVAACKASCQAAAGCEAIVVTTVVVEWGDHFKKCGLRRDVWEVKCSGDQQHDTHVMATPSPPPSPPRRPIARMSPSQRAADLNARFRDAHPSKDLARAGLVAHQFDQLERKGRPWEVCNYHCDTELNGRTLIGRLSAMIIYGRLRTRGDRQAVPLVSYDGGVIARPSEIELMCLFGIDGATVGLNGGPNGDGCPAAWCAPQLEPEPNGYCGFWGAPPDRAWRPSDLDTLLTLHEKHGEGYHEPGYHSGYNEAIVDGISWNAHLPNTIEAFFELEGQSAGTGQADYAREAHRRFLAAYGLSEHEVPLLKFDPFRWDAPFRAGAFETVRPQSPMEAINERFRRKPYDEWPADGSLVWSGVLLRCFDGYENHDQPWKPEHPEMSASLIFADQRVASHPIPVFSCDEGGIVFRPGFTTRVLCGNGGDSGGQCHSFCSTASDLGDVGSFTYPGDGCGGGSWRPTDCGMYLRRVATWQKRNGRSEYNEFILEGAGPRSVWSASLPDMVEAFFLPRGPTAQSVRAHYANFLREYDLDATRVPLLSLDREDWHSPFSELVQSESSESVLG